MKTATVFAVAALAHLGLFAQGTIYFLNNANSGISNSLTGASIVAGSDFNAALYYLPDSYYQPTAQDFDQSGAPLSPWASFYAPGLFDGGTRTNPVTPPGGFAWYQVRVWETSYGGSYEQAVAAPAVSGRRALAGTSNIIRVRAGGGENLPTLLTSAGLEAFLVTPVPESIVISDFHRDAVITFNTTTGHIYAVEKTSSLTPVNWQVLPGASNVVGTGNAVSVSDRNGGCLDDRYYRVRLVQ